MALGIWLYVLPPTVAVPLVLICSVIAQTSTMPSIWRTIDFKLVWPFLIGGLAGVPVGTLLIASRRSRHIQTERRRVAAGVSNRAVFPARADGIQLWRANGRCRIVGFAGGILGGLAGLSGPLPILWASVRGWNKEERRAIFQTFNWTVSGRRILPAGRRRPGPSGSDLAHAAGFSRHHDRRVAGRARLSRAERPKFPRHRARPVVSFRGWAGLEQHRRAVAPLFRAGSQSRTGTIAILIRPP